MKLIIAGCRNYSPTFDELDGHLTDLHCNEPVEIVHGGCPSGVDFVTNKWAITRNLKVSVFPANWAEHGKAAGPLRNKEMAKYGYALLAFWDGESRGTLSMITEAAKAGKHITVVPVVTK